jgi:hypothetical protein
MPLLIREFKQGVLPNGETVVVKKLNSSMLPAVKDKQFENEAYHLMRLKHPNIMLLFFDKKYCGGSSPQCSNF